MKRILLIATGGTIACAKTQNGLAPALDPSQLLARVPECHRPALLELLAQDPRPGYQHQPDRVYRLAFGGVEVGFLVDGEQLRVVEVR